MEPRTALSGPMSVRDARRLCPGIQLVKARPSIYVEKHHERGSYDHTQSYALRYREEPEDSASPQGELLLVGAVPPDR